MGTLPRAPECSAVVHGIQLRFLEDTPQHSRAKQTSEMQRNSRVSPLPCTITVRMLIASHLYVENKSGECMIGHTVNRCLETSVEYFFDGETCSLNAVLFDERKERLKIKITVPSRSN